MDTVIGGDRCAMATDLQAPQRQAQADPIAACDVAMDDDGGNGRLMQPGAAFETITEIVVYVDIGSAQAVNRLTQTGLGVRAHFGSQFTRIKQYEFSGFGLGCAHQPNEVAQGATRPQFKYASSIKSLLLKVVEEIGRKGMAATVRPADNQNTHDIALDTATQSECAMVWLCAVKAIRRNACNGVNFPQAA